MTRCGTYSPLAHSAPMTSMGRRRSSPMRGLGPRPDFFSAWCWSRRGWRCAQRSGWLRMDGNDQRRVDTVRRPGAYGDSSVRKLLHIGGEFDEIRCHLRSFPAFVEIGRGGPVLNRPGRSVFAAFGLATTSVVRSRVAQVVRPRRGKCDTRRTLRSGAYRGRARAAELV